MFEQQESHVYARPVTMPLACSPLITSEEPPLGPIRMVPIASLTESSFCRDIYDLIAPPDLLESVSRIGIQTPVWITAEDKIIAGHRRVDACRRLGITEIPAQVVPDFNGWSLESNIQRNKTTMEKLAEADAIVAYLAPLAKERQLAGVKVDPGQDLTKGRTMDLVAKHMGMSRTKAAQLFKIRDQWPDLLKKIDSGNKTAHTVIKTMQMEANKERQRTELLTEMNMSDINPVIQLGDFRKLGTAIPDNSISLLLTDPPYPARYLPLWDDLGALAARVLVPGGYLVSYSGHLHLPTCMAHLEKHLNYYWMMALLHAGQSKVVFARNLIADYKPILVYAKPPLGRNYRCFHDVVEGEKKEKALHEWQQDVRPFEELIHNFCPLGGRILEPFSGSGSVIRAAINCKRDVTAFEVNPDTYAILEQRFPKHTK